MKDAVAELLIRVPLVHVMPHVQPGLSVIVSQFLQPGQLTSGCGTPIFNVLGVAWSDSVVCARETGRAAIVEAAVTRATQIYDDIQLTIKNAADFVTTRSM